MNKKKNASKLNTFDIIKRLIKSDFYTKDVGELIIVCIELIQTKDYGKMKYAVMMIKDLYKSDCAYHQIKNLFKSASNSRVRKCIVFQKGGAYSFHSKEVIHSFNAE